MGGVPGSSDRPAPVVLPGTRYGPGPAGPSSKLSYGRPGAEVLDYVAGLAAAAAALALTGTATLTPSAQAAGPATETATAGAIA